MKTGVSQKAAILNSEGRILAVRRGKSAPSNPGQWDLPGGDLDFGEDALAGLKREVKEEVGLEIDNPVPFDVESHINELGEFWVTIAYRAKTDSAAVLLSYEHDEYRWVHREEFMELPSAEKLQRFIRNLSS